MPPTGGRSKLLDYKELYELWERQQWLTQELDFTQWDREDWVLDSAGGAPGVDVRPVVVLHRRAGGYAGARCLSDHAAPTEDMRVFLST